MTEEEHRVLGDREPFDYYLSRFLSATRTIDYRLRHEQSPIYPIWRKVWDAALSSHDNGLMKFMVGDRNIEVHESGSSRRVVEGSAELPIGTYRGGTSVIDRPPDASAPTADQPTFYFTIDGTERKATEACAEYLALLKRMVEKFEETATKACAEYRALLYRMMKKDQARLTLNLS